MSAAWIPTKSSDCPPALPERELPRKPPSAGTKGIGQNQVQNQRAPALKELQHPEPVLSG